MSLDDPELVECARYDEFVELKEMLDKGVNINVTDANGNTALHMSAGNGHLHIVKYLCGQGAKYLPNSSKNYPLHWAVQNKHVTVVEYLLEHPTYTKLIDVFAVNDFGISAVTNGFNNSCTEAVVVLLKHPSAEKKKNQDQENKENNEETNSSKTSKGKKKKKKKKKKNDLPEDLVEVTHEFCFAQNKNEVVSAREVSSLSLQWGTKVFDKVASDDTTGICVWAASILLSRWIVQSAELFSGKTVLELGAGCGLPGLVCRRYTQAKHVTLSDLYKLTLVNLQHNVDTNFGQDRNTDQNQNDSKTDSNNTDEKQPLFGSTDVNQFHKFKTTEVEEQRGISVRALDWAQAGGWPKAKVDIIIGSDLVYQKEVVPMFVRVLSLLLEPGGMIMYSARKERDGLDEFVTQMTKQGFSLTLSRCTADFFKNPLKSEDQEECDKFFELYEDHNYHFYKFVRNATVTTPTITTTANDSTIS